MKQQFLLALALALSGGAYAQSAERQVIGSSGSSFSSPALQVDYTTGETVTATGSSGSFLLTQGFQQQQAAGTAISEKGLLVNFALYPNPANDVVTLSLHAARPFVLSTSLTNLAGQVIRPVSAAEKITQRSEMQITVQGLPAGVYFVNLYDEGNSLIQSIRFVKQ